MNAAPAKRRSLHAVPDLTDFRKQYPLTVAHLGTLADREAWLRRIWEMDQRWQERMSDHDGKSALECVVKGAPPAGLSVEAEFEVIFAGGVLGLLHGAMMSHRYHRRVMVFDEHSVGVARHEWNISAEELLELERTGLFTTAEIESSILNRYRSGFVKFHDVASRIKTPRLWLEGVLDVAIEAESLLALAAIKVRSSDTSSLVMDGLRFVRCYVQADKVLVEVEETNTKKRKLFGARLFVDATESGSPVARQLNGGGRATHVRPAVGTIARGFVRGPEPDQADFSVGEILVSNEDARDHRQLMWEAFAGSPSRDEYRTCLFFYDAIDSPADKSLLSLFERYFESLPGYKRAGAHWRVVKPLFGYAPGLHHNGKGDGRRTAENRVLLTGDGAQLSGPLTLSGFGSYARNLRRLAHLTELALDGDLLDAASLSEINACGPRVAQVSSLAELMRPARRSAPPVVNETMNAMMAALHDLDEGARRDFFHDRMSFSAFKNLLGRTLKLYPRILHRVREHLGARGTFWWLAGITESLLHEYRSRHQVIETSPPPHDENAGDRFARYIALYRNGEHADDV